MQRTYKDCISIKISAAAGLEAEASCHIPEADQLTPGWPREAVRKPEAHHAPVLKVDLPEAAVRLGHPQTKLVIWAQSRLAILTWRHFLMRHPRGVEDKLVIDGGEVAQPRPGDSCPRETGVILIYPHPLPARGHRPGQPASRVIRVAVELAWGKNTLLAGFRQKMIKYEIDFAKQ